MPGLVPTCQHLQLQTGNSRRRRLLGTVGSHLQPPVVRLTRGLLKSRTWHRPKPASLRAAEQGRLLLSAICWRGTLGSFPRACATRSPRPRLCCAWSPPRNWRCLSTRMSSFWDLSCPRRPALLARRHRARCTVFADRHVAGGQGHRPGLFRRPSEPPPEERLSPAA